MDVPDRCVDVPDRCGSSDLPQNMTNAQPMAQKILRMNAAAVATWAVVEPAWFGDGFE